MTFAIPYSFIAGEKARSAEVNANFSYLMNALNTIADTTTIDLSASTNKLSSIGVKDVNSGNPVKTWTGLQEEYDAITTKDPMTVYYLTDTGSVFLGETSVGGGKGSRLMGEIITSTVPLTDASVHLLDGAIIAGDGVYADFVNYMKNLYDNTTNANFFTTEANWQAAISAKGICGKFVYDSTNNTVRLPKVTGIIEGAADATTLGNTVNAGLPNIKGRFQGSGESASDAVGAFYKYGSGWQVSNSGDRDNIYAFDASRDAAVAIQARGIYRDNCYTVQPQTIKVLYYIVLASSTKSSTQVDIDEIVTDLNSKADKDLSNCTKPHIVETYSNGNSWYRLYSDGWCEQGGIADRGSYQSSGNLDVTLLKNYKDTNYSVMCSMKDADNNNDFQVNASINPNSYTTSGFRLTFYSLNQGQDDQRYAVWEAKGYTT